MLNALRPITLFMVLLVVGGCHIGKMDRLEKQNEELKAELKKRDAVADFDLQAKCAKDARAWFNENWPRDKDTLLLDFSNHYNKASNKCFIMVEYHYSTDKNGSWVNDMMLYDVYENARFGTYTNTTMIFPKPTYHFFEKVSDCNILDKRCKSVDEFNNLVRSYMND